jgi:hypothetical protein
VSKWADLYTLHDNSVHLVPMDVLEIPPLEKVRDHVFGHLPLATCHCKPHVRFSSDGEYLVISHRDHERGSLTPCGEILQ